MGITYLWDTNTVIYYLQKQFSPAAEIFIDQLITVSILVQDFIDDALVFELERPIKFEGR